MTTGCAKCGKPHVRLGRRTCRAHRRDGAPCMTFPVGGAECGTVCRMHGGSTRHYRANVEMRTIEERLLGIVRRKLERDDRRRTTWP